MRKINIPLLGITRNTDDGISTDGECMELINARVKNGSITPIGRPILIKQYVDIQATYMHVNSNYKNTILFAGNIGLNEKKSFYFVVENNSAVKMHEEITADFSINHVGNILCISTDNNIVYFFFENNSYRSLGSGPGYPTVSLDVKMLDTKTENDMYADINPAKPYPNSIREGIPLNESSINVSNAIFGSLARMYSEVKDEGNFLYPFLLRFAYKMYDGSYIMQSNPMLVKGDGILFQHAENKDHLVENLSLGIKYAADNHDGNLTGIKFDALCNPYELKFNIKYPSNLGKWKDLIVGVDVFISLPFETINLNEQISHLSLYLDNNGKAIRLNIKGVNTETINNKIKQESIFYKVLSIDTKDGIHTVPAIVDISGKETLPDDSFSHNKMVGASSYVYNNKLHIAGIKNKLFDGFNISQFLNTSTKNENTEITPCNITSGHIEVHIKTESGIAKVFHEFGFISNMYGLYFVSYPDSRAFKMIIHINTGSVLTKELDLKPSEVLNISYYEPDITKALSHLDFSSASSRVPIRENNIEFSPNKIKVSEISNPFFFPLKQTYIVGNGNIVGLCSNTNAVSQGQFGQYPMYVFTSDGIYVMQVGSGSVAYSSISPINRSVCNNRNSITPIDSAVIFSSDAGLMMISGSVTEKLSSDIEGYLPSAVDTSAAIKSILSIEGMIHSASKTDFITYIENACIGYNNEEREIIVSNRNYQYSYVLNLHSRSWHKTDYSISKFLNSYPECLAVFVDGNKYGIYNVQNHHRTVNTIAIVTRPIKLGSLSHKRVLQTALRGVVRPSMSDLYLRGEPVMFRSEQVNIFSNTGFYILASNDAEHFIIVSGTEKIIDIRDLITKMNKTKAYKYFAIAIIGGVRTDVAFNFIELVVDEAFENRLR